MKAPPNPAPPRPAPPNAAPGTAPECARCQKPLRQEWNFCPDCAFPVGTDPGTLSSQIRVLLPPPLDPGLPRPGPAPGPRWPAIFAGLGLVVALGAVGVFVWHPERLAALLGTPPRSSLPLPAPSDAPDPGTPGLRWILVPAGEFGYGPPAEGHPFSETVDLPAFEISQYEITNEQWREYLLARREDLVASGKWRAAVPSYWEWPGKETGDPPPEGIGEGGVRLPPEEAALPVRGITFEQASIDFCGWLDRSGRARGARLPAEDEWEKAARGTAAPTYPWGEKFWFEARVPGTSETFLEPGAVVRQGKPSAVNSPGHDVSPCGVYHMGGNVSEWTDLRRLAPGETRSAGPHDLYRAIRGASYQDGKDGEFYAKTWRNDVRWELRVSALFVGFRVARSVPEPSGKR